LRKFVVGLIVLALLSVLLPLTFVLAQAPQAELTSPLANTQIRGRVQVKGSANHPSFDFYKVEFGPGENPSDDKMSIIGTIHKEQITNNLLETWDTTAIPDGTYTLRLRVVDKTGNYKEVWARRLSVANTAPVDTPTPSAPAATPTEGLPTITPTMIPATPTIVVDQPFLAATPLPTPPPIATGEAVTTSVQPGQAPTAQAVAVAASPASPATPEPPASESGANGVLSALPGLFDVNKLSNSLCYGAGFMAAVFLFFGFLSGLRRAVLYLIKHQ
jgi:hypothetical protein